MSSQPPASLTDDHNYFAAPAALGAATGARRPDLPPDSWSTGGYGAATGWGLSGMGVGAVAGGFIGWAATAGMTGETVWVYQLLALAAGLALGMFLGGSASLWYGLRRGRFPHAAATALVFLPTAVLLGAFAVGIGVFGAPALARWIVLGFVRKPAVAGYGPPAATCTPAGAGWRNVPHGGGQRLLVAIAVVGVGAKALVLALRAVTG